MPPFRSTTVEFDDAPTKEKFIPEVMTRATCNSHGASHGSPCYVIPSEDGFSFFPAICNARAKRAGMNHEIRPASLEVFASRGNRRR